MIPINNLDDEMAGALMLRIQRAIYITNFLPYVDFQMNSRSQCKVLSNGRKLLKKFQKTNF